MRQTLSHFPLKNSSSQFYQIHHIFAFSRVGQPLVPFLRGLGLNCTEPQKNHTQGTVSTLIFFDNVYLELLWFDEKSHLTQSEMSKEFNFIARADWPKTRASPFGLSLCYPTDNDDLITATIDAIKTDREQLSEQLRRFSPGTLANLEEPILGVVPDYVATDDRLNKFLAIPEQNVTQTSDIRQLTHVKLKITSDRALSTSLKSLAEQNVLNIEQSKYPLLELNFDHGQQKKSLDLRPLLPIVLRY